MGADDTRLGYRRSEVEEALWRVFATGPNHQTPAAVPPAFRTRIKRLLEIDRTADLSDRPVKSKAPFAFAREAPPGTGHDVPFGYVDALALALALELLDAGFKQFEVVYLMRYFRADLDGLFNALIVEGEAGRGSVARIDPQTRDLAIDTDAESDNRVFLIIQKLDLKELVPARAGSKRAPMILEPRVLHGLARLSAELAAMPKRRRKAMVIEIAGLANAVVAALLKLPKGRRLRS